MLGQSGADLVGWLQAGLRTEQMCIKEMLEGRQIERSDSPWASPVVLVTKKDGPTCFYVDCRRLNSLTVKDSYPLPRIDDSLRLLGLTSSGSPLWIWLVDIGRWPCRRTLSGRQHFVTHEGVFQFRVMPFGLCNAPATFERLMDSGAMRDAMVAVFGLP